jgi:hypothetical protein
MANKLNVVLGLDVSQFQRGLNLASARLSNFSRNLESVGTDLTTRLTLPLAGVGAASLAAFAELDKFTKGLGAVMGSTEAAEAELVKLREVAKLPGLGFVEAVQGSTNLQAVGLSADQARATLQGFGAAIAATGGGAQELGEVQKQLTQIISKNRILQEDYGVLQERVPLIGRALKQAFGTENIEQVREAGVTGKQFVEAISQALITLPQTQNLTGGLANALENFGDSARVGAARLGEVINEALGVEEILGKVSDAINKAIDTFTSLNPVVQKTIVIIAAVVAGIGPLLFGIGAFVKLAAFVVAGFAAISKAATASIAAVKAFGLAFNVATLKITLIIGAILAVIAALVYLYNNFEGVRRVINGVINVFVEFFKILKEGGGAVIRGIGAILKGEFLEGGKLIAEGLIKTNPIGIAATQGKRLGEAFNEGYQDETNKLQKIQDDIKSFLFKQPTEVPVVPVVEENPENNDGGEGGNENTGGANIKTDAINVQALIDKSLAEQAKKVLEDLGKTGVKSFDDVARAAMGLNGQLKEIPDVKSPIDITNEALRSYQTEIENSRAAAAIFGTTAGDLLSQQIGTTTSAINQAIEAYGINSVVVEELTEKYNALVAQYQLANEEKRIQTELENTFGAAFQASAAIIEQSGASVKSILRGVGQAVRQAAAEFIQAKVREATASFIADNFKKAGIFGVIGAAAAGAIVGGLFNAALSKIGPPKLARGGITTGETLAVVGDNPSGREAIIPFERMGEFLDMAGGGGTRLSGIFEVRGQDLVLALDRANQTKSRIR